MAKELYDPHVLSKKWQDIWEETKIYQPDMDTASKPYYVLMMFPYPSAEGLHIGSIYSYTGADTYARYKRMQGYDVFHPMGLDAFGIHSENYALKIGKHPMDQAEVAETNFYRQLHATGNSYDWSRKLETSSVDYYMWTQWLFIELFKKGLAYRKKAPVNYCPSCMTVLSDEQVIDGKCERCGSVVEKRDLEQWFFRITAYSERLLSHIPELNWSEKVKVAQHNWIGKKTGAVITFDLPAVSSKIEVFTTRPDTLYGVTALIIAPDHPFLKDESFLNALQDKEQVLNYVKTHTSVSLSPEEEANKEKTGINTGITARHPLTGEEIPVWVSDYVLMGYGTGAIMAVPAHDERDFEFARKLGIPIRQVIAPEFGMKRVDEERRDGAYAVIFNPQTQKYVMYEKEDGKLGFFGGGTDTNESEEEGIRREVREESGLHEFSHAENVLTSFVHYKHSTKHLNRFTRASCYLLVLSSDKRVPQKLEAHESFQVVEKDAQEILQNFAERNVEHNIDHWIIGFTKAVNQAIALGVDKTNEAETGVDGAYVGEGILINSKKWNGLVMPKEMDKVISDLEAVGVGKRQVNYHLRDWLISRQRYWGPPIPMVYCQSCAASGRGAIDAADWNASGWYPAEDLPVKLPYIKDYRPIGTGASPLGNHPEFYTVSCPGCGGEAKRETDVSDTFLDSAWYFFRYTSTDKKDEAFDTVRLKKWLPVPIYIGGAEHSVLHLLYARFMTMVLHDLGYIDFDEPFARFYAHGLIIKDGAKMSKSKGNVVLPDPLIQKFGIDTVRMYLRFLGPFSEGGDFRDTGIEGMHRFMKRLWVFFTGQTFTSTEGSRAAKHMRHKTIKSVTEDMEALRFNTAIAKLMEWYNFMAKETEVGREDAMVLVRLLAPFAPHMAEEVWERLGQPYSVHTSAWPVWDPAHLVEDTVVIAVQINGKVRGTLAFAHGDKELSDKDMLVAKAHEHERIAAFLADKVVKTVVYVPEKILNFVV